LRGRVISRNAIRIVFTRASSFRRTAKMIGIQLMRSAPLARSQRTSRFATRLACSSVTIIEMSRWFAAIRERPAWHATDRMKRETLAAFGITF
jgi:hypothetical protein